MTELALRHLLYVVCADGESFLEAAQGVSLVREIGLLCV